MPIKKSYRRTVLFYLIVVFFLFTAAILVYQLSREKKYRTEQLENSLDNYTELINLYINQNKLMINKNLEAIDSLKKILPDSDIRITIIDKDGKVLFDSFVEDYEKMENHLERPEIQKARYSDTGSNIRGSVTTNRDYYYYARYFNDYYIRVAEPYNIELQHFLKGSRFFLIFIAALFFLLWLLINYVTKKLTETITKLKDFSIRAGRGETFLPVPEFPDNELGVISSQIIQIFNNLKKAKDDIENDKEKLFNHLNVLNEGISFFSADKEKILANSHFILYINMISEKSTISAQNIFNIPEFEPVNKFIHENQPAENQTSHGTLPQLEYVITKNEKYFKIHCIIFNDNSFEILISDITRPEKRRLLKQQLTSNIAHELKTPLSSIKGYLETLMSNGNIDKQKQNYFLERAYAQSERLSHLLNDISLINNMEDAGDLFEFKKINIRDIISDVIENLGGRLSKKSIACQNGVSENVTILGNDALIASVFQNLIENVINYAGENVTVIIKNYLEDDMFHYFSFSDNGIGIPEEHIPRIFERFYRIDPGRTREMGGTGLGLSIVKHAILLHKGDISARNKPDGGLEFIFTLAK